MKKIYVATYTDSTGQGYQKVFDERPLAQDFIKKRFIKDFQDVLPEERGISLAEWKQYGAFTAKIKSFWI